MTPYIIIFLLERNNDQINIELSQKICLKKFANEFCYYTNYELNGIVSYDKNNNKYVCYSVSPIDKSWYSYNDEIVNNTDFNSIFQSHSQQNNNFIPNILLYKVIN